MVFHMVNGKEVWSLGTVGTSGCKDTRTGLPSSEKPMSIDPPTRQERIATQVATDHQPVPCRRTTRRFKYENGSNPDYRRSKHTSR